VRKNLSEKFSHPAGSGAMESLKGEDRLSAGEKIYFSNRYYLQDHRKFTGTSPKDYREKSARPARINRETAAKLPKNYRKMSAKKGQKIPPMPLNN
jgi:hypothetical protein